MSRFKRPTISCVIPIYNKESWLAESIQSVLDQTEKVNQIILVDDGSTDSSLEIAQYYIQEYDGRVNLLKNDRNEGIGFTRNKGNRFARGDWIMVQDADDISYPDRVEKFLKYLEKHPTTAYYYTAIDVANEKLEIYDRWPSGEVTAEKLRKGQVVPHATSIYRRNWAIDIPYLDSNRMNDDYDQIVSMWNEGAIFGYNPTPTTLYRVLPSGVSSKNYEAIQKTLPAIQARVRDRV